MNNKTSADEIVGYILAIHAVRSALAFGKDSAQFVAALREHSVRVGWDEEGDECPAVGDASCDLCICINYCDYLPLAKSDQWVDFLSAHFSLILFESGVPSKKRPSEKTDQAQHYWASMFELRGCSLVRGFGQSNRMPFLFLSGSADRIDQGMVCAADPAGFDWRKTFEMRIEHRAPSLEARRGPDTAGQARKVAAAVVTFNPSPDELEQIRRLANIFDAVVIADNSEPGLDPIPGAEWAAMGGNKGIGAALNAACRLARELGYEWLLTLDQDATIEEGAIESYLAVFTEFDDKEGTAVVAPRSNGKEVPLDGASVRDMEMVITSGSLMNLAIWEKVGGFTEELFIDEVDHDYCLKARNSGYRVVKLYNAQITHQAGQLMTVLTLRGRPAMASSHPPIRLYYMSRNYFYLRNHYRSTHPHIIAFQRQHLLGKFKEYLLYHKNPWPSIFAMIKGAMHGMAGRFGR